MTGFRDLGAVPVRTIFSLTCGEQVSLESCTPVPQSSYRMELEILKSISYKLMVFSV